MTEREWIFLAFTALSVLFLAFYTWYSFFVYRKIEQSKRAFTVAVFYTVGVFISTLLVFIPVYYLRYGFGDSFAFVRPLLIAFHNTLRVFILDGEFDTVIWASRGLSEWLHVAYTAYCSVLYVVAPVLTLGSVLSFFRNFRSEIRYRFCGKRRVFIFSELNVGSLALAKSIMRKYPQEKPVFVYTDVYEQNEESSHELALEANNINAICLKKDVTHLNVSAKKGSVEIFLIGSDESENISQAAVLTERFNGENKKQDIKIFVFAVGRESGYIIDSLNYDALLKRATDEGFVDGTFRIRRVNCVKQLVWRSVPGMELFDRCKNKTVSVMIAGLGSFGTEFFKMLVWYCQMEGYTLELNIFDKSRDRVTGEAVTIVSRLARQCPEVFRKNPSADENDAKYDIRCFDFVDFSCDSFERLWDDQEIAGRLGRTTAVLVALGDDDQNIETAVYLRSLFDRKNGITAHEQYGMKDESPDIYSIVYDGTKSGTVSDGGDGFLRNYKRIPYNIRFIGGTEQQYDYDNVYDAATEKDAFRYHVEWTKVSEDNVMKAQAACYDPEKITELERSELEKLKNAQADYERYEYYRLSSMAKAIHKKAVPGNSETALKTEHIRWNAYMRTEGYSFGRRADRALVHDELTDWETYKKENKASVKKDR